MEDNTKTIDPLVLAVVNYSKSGFQLLKLKTLEKFAGIVSEAVPRTMFLTALTVFVIFLSLGIAFWLGKILGEIYFGFFIVAAFYLIVGLVLHLFFHNTLKRKISNYVIKQALN